MWNGEKYCTSCMKGCAKNKETFKDIDCEKFCTVEYGAPKPTDEDSVDFKSFVDSVYKGEVTRVDFYGSAGDKVVVFPRECPELSLCLGREGACDKRHVTRHPKP
jgi:hypothetical protein